jgi:protein HIRA/HIR1
LNLYAASSDGTIAAFSFEPEELDGIAPIADQEDYLKKFSFIPPEIPKGYSHTSELDTAPTKAQAPSSSATFSEQANGTGERVNVLVAKRSKKRPNLNTIPSAAIPSASAPPSHRHTHVPQPPQEHMSISAARRPSFDHRFPSPSEQPFATHGSWSRHADVGMDLDVPINTIDTGSKRKSSVMGFEEDGRPATKARTLGGDRKRDSVPVKEIQSPAKAATVAVSWSSSSVGPVLPVPPVLNSLSAEVEGSDETFEGRNYEDSGEFGSYIISGHFLKVPDRTNRGLFQQWQEYAMAGLPALACGHIGSYIDIQRSSDA